MRGQPYVSCVKLSISKTIVSRRRGYADITRMVFYGEIEAVGADGVRTSDPP